MGVRIPIPPRGFAEIWSTVVCTQDVLKETKLQPTEATNSTSTDTTWSKATRQKTENKWSKWPLAWLGFWFGASPHPDLVRRQNQCRNLTDQQVWFPGVYRVCMVANPWDHTDPVYPINSSVNWHLTGIANHNINPRLLWDAFYWFTVKYKNF